MALRDEPFEKQLAQLLERAGLSHNRFAEMAGTTQGTVSLCIRGERPPPLDQLKKWAEALGLTESTVNDDGELVLREFLRAGRRAKAKAQTEALPYIGTLEDELRGVEAAYVGLERRYLALLRYGNDLEDEAADLRKRLGLPEKPRRLTRQGIPSGPEGSGPAL